MQSMGLAWSHALIGKQALSILSSNAICSVWYALIVCIASVLVSLEFKVNTVLMLSDVCLMLSDVCLSRIRQAFSDVFHFHLVNSRSVWYHYYCHRSKCLHKRSAIVANHKI